MELGPIIRGKEFKVMIDDGEEQLREGFLYPIIDINSIVFDIGSRYGSWTLTSLRHGATVYSSDFNPHYNQALLDNVLLNDGFIDRFHLISSGVYSHELTGPYYGFDNITFTTIDKFSQERNVMPDFIRIDVKGSELMILDGAQNTLKNLPKLFIKNYHGEAGEMALTKYLHHYQLISAKKGYCFFY